MVEKKRRVPSRTESPRLDEIKDPRTIELAEAKLPKLEAISPETFIDAIKQYFIDIGVVSIDDTEIDSESVLELLRQTLPEEWGDLSSEQLFELIHMNMVLAAVMNDVLFSFDLPEQLVAGIKNLVVANADFFSGFADETAAAPEALKATINPNIRDEMLELKRLQAIQNQEIEPYPLEILQERKRRGKNSKLLIQVNNLPIDRLSRLDPEMWIEFSLWDLEELEADEMLKILATIQQWAEEYGVWIKSDGQIFPGE